MLQRDYIQRMIEQLAEVTAELLHLPLTDARKVLTEASAQHVDLPLNEVYRLPLDTLVDSLATTHRMDWTRIEFLGYLLSKDGDYLLQTNMPTDALAAYQRAYACLDYADLQSGVYDAHRMDCLAALKRRMATI